MNSFIYLWLFCFWIGLMICFYAVIFLGKEVKRLNSYLVEIKGLEQYKEWKKKLK